MCKRLFWNCSKKEMVSLRTNCIVICNKYISQPHHSKLEVDYLQQCFDVKKQCWHSTKCEFPKNIHVVWKLNKSYIFLSHNFHYDTVLFWKFWPSLLKADQEECKTVGKLPWWLPTSQTDCVDQISLSKVGWASIHSKLKSNWGKRVRKRWNSAARCLSSIFQALREN